MQEPEKILVVWNDNDFSKIIQTTFVWADVNTSEDDLHANPKSLDKYRGIVQLAEFNTNSRKAHDFYGFEILCRLRSEYRLRCPIVICSFMPELYLRKKFPILDFSQHHPFVRLPEKPEGFIRAIENAEFADEPRLNDIISSYCDLTGRLIKLITHGTGFRQITSTSTVIHVEGSIWTNCEQNLFLLKKYLAGNLLGSAVSAQGGALVARLREAIQSREIGKLLATKPLFDDLISELVGAKGLSVTHLKKEK